MPTWPWYADLSPPRKAAFWLAIITAAPVLWLGLTHEKVVVVTGAGTQGNPAQEQSYDCGHALRYAVDLVPHSNLYLTKDAIWQRDGEEFHTNLVHDCRPTLYARRRAVLVIGGVGFGIALLLVYAGRRREPA